MWILGTKIQRQNNKTNKYGDNEFTAFSQQYNNKAGNQQFKQIAESIIK